MFNQSVLVFVSIPTRSTYVDEYFSNLNDTLEYSSASTPELPPHLQFNNNTLTVIIVYCILFVIAAIGNLSVFLSLIRGRHRKSRMCLMMTHLTIADLVVTFIMIPLEIGWRLTTQWIAGNAACKLFLFLRAFGLYLSSNVLVCISIDRYFAVLHPLRVSDARRRGKMMLTLAWVLSFVCSVPQSIVFHVSEHPEYPKFYQCVSFDYFSSKANETTYNVFCVCAMYFIPLLIISFAYSCILFVITKKSRETKDAACRINEDCENVRGRLRLRRSDISNIERARSRTLRMSIVIVATFICCWTPYVFMTMWYIFDRQSAETVDSRIQDGLFIMAVSNSCMNPVVYGSYAINLQRDCCKCFVFLFGDSWTRKNTVAIPKPSEVFSVKHCVATLVKVGSHTNTRSTAVQALPQRKKKKSTQSRSMYHLESTGVLQREELQLKERLFDFHSNPENTSASMAEPGDCQAVRKKCSVVCNKCFVVNTEYFVTLAQTVKNSNNADEKRTKEEQ